MDDLSKRDSKLPYCYNMRGERCETCKQCGFSKCSNKSLKFKKRQ